MGISTIYLDMDDVLVDFDRGVCQLFGVNYPVAMNKRNGCWDMSVCLGLEPGELVAKLKHNNEFWYGLKELPWFDELWELTNNYASVCIVSAPMDNSITVQQGKLDWLERKFGRDFNQYRLLQEKELLAGPDKLLIDDRKENCDKFIQAGGNSILFPAYGNELSYLRGDMKFITKCLEKVFHEV